MKPINFEQSNCTFVGDNVGDNCGNLPVSLQYNEEFRLNQLTSCWEPTDKELEYIKDCINNNEKPKFYLSILGGSQPPVWVGCNLYDIEIKED